MSTKNTLDNIRIVLIQTSHPGNIGSAARAMKTMGLSDLCLVNPKSFPDEQAVAMSSNATDILEQACVVDSLQQAIADCQLVMGSSARYERSLAWDNQSPRECAKQVVKQAQSGKVALLFGRESSGLTNEEIAQCQHLVHVPTNPEYSSLNVASAVQILSYECRSAFLAHMAGDSSAIQTNKADSDVEQVTAGDMEGYYQQLESIMIEAQFLDPQKPRHLMARLRRLYSRAQVTRSELNILRGMLSAFKKK